MARPKEATGLEKVLKERELYYSTRLERVRELQALDIKKNRALTATHFINLLKVVDDHLVYKEAEEAKAKRLSKTKSYTKLVKDVDNRLSKGKSINETAKELYSKRGKS